MNTSPDREIFLNLIQDNRRIIFKICHSYCNHKTDREDLAQEIIYQLWKSYHSYNNEFKFSTWMYRVALNVAISFYRKEKRSANTFSLSEELLEIKDDAEHSIELEENISLLQQFIHGFKELDRALIILYLEDKSYKEIAEVLGISTTNAATKISRVKEKLKQKFITSK